MAMVWDFIGAHPYLQIYLIGVCASFALSLSAAILFKVIYWVTGEHVLQKNLKKIRPPDENSFLEKILGGLLLRVLESLLSWVDVPIILWLTMQGLLKLLREWFSSVPEEIKLLRFPLWHNPDMSVEAVWAYVNAVAIRAGETPNWDVMMGRLDNMAEINPRINRQNAIEILENLKVMPPRPSPV